MTSKTTVNGYVYYMHGKLININGWANICTQTDISVNNLGNLYYLFREKSVQKNILLLYRKCTKGQNWIFNWHHFCELTCWICCNRACFSSVECCIVARVAVKPSSSCRAECRSVFSSVRSSRSLLCSAAPASCSSARAFSFSASCFFSFTTGSCLPWNNRFTSIQSGP